MSETLRILAIKPTQRDPDRATIRVGSDELTHKGVPRKGKVVVTLYRSAIEALGLRVGEVWDDALAERVAQAGDEDQAYRAASRRIARRAMSSGMIDQKLRELGYEPETRARVLARLDRLGLLDDAAYGRALIRETTRSKPAGPRLLRQKLFAKRLNASLIDRLIREHEQEHAQHAEDHDESPHADAMAYAVKKSRAMARLAPEVRRRRLYGQLARRGFNPDTIRAAMDAADAASRDSHADEQ